MRGLIKLLMVALLLVCVQQSWAQVKTARLGLLMFSEETRKQPWHATLISILEQRGWIQGKNLHLEYRYARGKDQQFAKAAQELVDLNPNVIFAGSAPAVRAAYALTKTIPIVALDYTTDPVAAGYALSYAHPGKNVTGVFLDAPELAGKWVEVLREIVPHLKRIVVLWDPNTGTVHLRAVQLAAKGFNLQAQVHEVRAPDDFEKVLAASRASAQALIVLPSALVHTYSAQLASLLLKYKLPATSIHRAFVEAGGTIAYGPVFSETIQRNAAQIAKILDGAKPGDMPIERPMKFDFLYNMSTMKALNLKVPESLLLGAEMVGK